MIGLRDAVGFRVHMGWRHVLFASWPVHPEVVAGRLPPGLEVDTYDGRAWLSVVPFVNVDVRPAKLPSGWGFRLPELNLRTYVTAADEPGVYFYNLDADGLLGVAGGRLLHGLPYYHARIHLDAGDGRVRFASRRRHPGAPPARFRATYGPTGSAFAAEPGSLEAFLVERYRYYVGARDGLRRADVDHDPWPLQLAEVDLRENGLFAANGFARPEGEPVVLSSPGVDTVAEPSRRA